jgi:alpha,alpha-trehalase
MTQDAWRWTYTGYDPAEEPLRETLCATGNGYITTRGSLPESVHDDVHHPGTYLAGVYNRLTDEVAGRSVENESMVNVPSWLPVTITADDGMPFDVEHCEVLHHHLELDLARSLLVRQSRLAHPDGRVLDVTQRRFVSLRDRHLAAVETTLVAEGWEGDVQVCVALDGTVRNDGVARYRGLGTDHLRHVDACHHTPEIVCLDVETSSSRVHIAQSARTRVLRDGEEIAVDRTTETAERWVGQRFPLHLAAGEQTTVEKVVAIYTSRDPGIYEPHEAAQSEVGRLDAGFSELLERHVLSWKHAWARSRIEVGGSGTHTARVLNLHIFHLLQTVSKNTAELDVGVPARGLHGEAYRGHVFWDELFIFPYLSWRLPELTRALLRYRSRRLDEARKAAAAAGYAGAMFPWQSASDGREQTQTLHLNPESGRWLPDASHLQRHVNLAIAFNVWSYWQATRDLEFMRFWGAELYLEIARFWGSAATYNHALDRYELKGVMGPDEYHEGYPGRDEPGLDNNAYTNVMASWCLAHAPDMLALLPRPRRAQLLEKLDLSGSELDRWDDISRRLVVPFHDGGVISQFEGYDDLAELDWDRYRAQYGDIHRLDRILEAEGDSPNRYKLSKQPDVLMLFYLLSRDELARLFDRLGYDWDDDLVSRTVAYYHQRTSHGSTLSRMIHAWIAARTDPDRSWSEFRAALLADVEDEQGGTTGEGIHLGAMAGTVDLVQRCYTGMEIRDEKLFFDPALPRAIESLDLQMHYIAHPINVHLTGDELEVSLGQDGSDEVTVVVRGDERVLRAGEVVRFKL